MGIIDYIAIGIITVSAIFLGMAWLLRKVEDFLGWLGDKLFGAGVVILLFSLVGWFVS